MLPNEQPEEHQAVTTQPVLKFQHPASREVRKSRFASGTDRGCGGAQPQRVRIYADARLVRSDAMTQPRSVPEVTSGCFGARLLEQIRAGKSGGRINGSWRGIAARLARQQFIEFFGRMIGEKLIGGQSRGRIGFG
jgi:hypothetical protein